MPIVYQSGQQIDHYTIAASLGHGGSSQVYLAQDQHTGENVVLKFPHIDELGSMDVFARYQRERAIGKRLSHTLLQDQLYQDERRSEEYVVLEYLPGRDLRALMKFHAPSLLPVDNVLRIIRCVVEALVYVHGQGVIHRDVKPENILIEEQGRVVLCDFGIAQWQGERFLRWRGFSTLIGTPCYMAPELLRAKAGTVQTDIYAVGAVLYELLCGKTPFQEQNEFEFMTRHISHDPPAILLCNPDLSPALATIVMRAVRRDPQKRYASMQELMHDLDHLDQVVVEPYRPDPPLLGGRYRQILLVVLIILLLCLLIIAFGVLAQFAHPAAQHNPFS